MFLLNAGNPINELGSGIDLQNGWDWYSVPGATASHYPVEERSDKAVKEARKKAGLPYRSIHRNYNSRTFVGGVSLGEFGIFVHDLEAVPFTAPTDLKGRKTYLFVDGKILAIGSHIRGGTSTDPTRATIFQTKLPSPNTATSVQARILRGLETDERIDRFDNGTALTDSVGNRYLIVESSAPLRVTRRMQNSLTPEYQPTRGAYATAFLDHGI